MILSIAHVDVLYVREVYGLAQLRELKQHSHGPPSTSFNMIMIMIMIMIISIIFIIIRFTAEHSVNPHITPLLRRISAGRTGHNGVLRELHNVVPNTLVAV